MIRILLVAVLALVAPSASFAQVEIGPRIGVNFSSVKANGGSNTIKQSLNRYFKGHNGLLAGAVIRFGLSERLAMQTEIALAQLGYKNVFNAQTATYRQTYLQVPILATARLNKKAAKANLYVLAGAYAGYWIAGKMKAEINSKEQSLDFFFDDNDKDDGIKDNRIDYGLTGGLAFGFPIGFARLVADVRYSYGLSDIFSYKTERPSTMPRLGIRNTSVAVSYLFTLGTKAVTGKNEAIEGQL